MTQTFPNIQGTDYIDEGIFDLQDRDNSVVTLFAGYEEPENPFEDLVWNDLTNRCLKVYNNGSWIILIDYGKEYIAKERMLMYFQQLSGTLTTYSNVSTEGAPGFVNNTWIPISYFFINNLLTDFENSIGLKSFAYKSKIATSDFSDGSVSVTQLDNSIVTTAPYRVGDCIVSFNNGTKQGCVKLSTKASTIYTVGGSSSGSTYKGNVYQKLYEFIHTKMNLRIYSSTGVITTKSSNWQTDWNNNKRLELPHIDLPTENTPNNTTIISSSINGDRSGENLSITKQFNSQKVVSGTITIPKSGYYRLILVGGGGGSSDRGNHDDGNGTGGAGAYFKATLLLNAGSATYAIGYGGKGCDEYARNHCGFDGSYSRFSTQDVYINCPGGYGGRCSRTSHVDSAILARAPYYQGYSFAPSYTVNTGYLSIEGVSTNGLRQDSWYSPYGKGGDEVGGKSSGKVGNNGFISLTYIGPKEYGTTNSTIINALNSLYPNLSYFMKF